MIPNAYCASAAAVAWLILIISLITRAAIRQKLLRLAMTEIPEDRIGQAAGGLSRVWNWLIQPSRNLSELKKRHQDLPKNIRLMIRLVSILGLISILLFVFILSASLLVGTVCA